MSNPAVDLIANPIAAGVGSVVGPLAYLAAVPMPAAAAHLTEWLPFATGLMTTVVGPSLVFVGTRLLKGRRAKKAKREELARKRSAERRAEAARLEADGIAANDAEAARLRQLANEDEDEADELAAEVAELDALAAKKGERE
jgi:hypothetical protein